MAIDPRREYGDWMIVDCDVDTDATPEFDGTTVRLLKIREGGTPPSSAHVEICHDYWTLAISYDEAGELVACLHEAMRKIERAMDEWPRLIHDEGHSDRIVGQGSGPNSDELHVEIWSPGAVKSTGKHFGDETIGTGTVVVVKWDGTFVRIAKACYAE